MMKSVLLGIIISFYLACEVDAQTPFYINQYIYDGYTDKFSYRANETVGFYLNSGSFQNQLQSDYHSTYNLNYPTPQSDPSYPSNTDVELVLFDIYGNPVYNILATSPLQFQGIQYPSNMPPYQFGFGYIPTVEWTVPCSLPSGYYYIKTSSDRRSIPVIIKNPRKTSCSTAQTPDVVVVIPTNTEQAYNWYPTNDHNTCGNLYALGDPNIARGLYPFANPGVTELSIHRQYLPQDFLKHGFLTWFATWAPSTSATKSSAYTVNYISDMDLDNDYSEISAAKIIIIIGHSEYWTRQARLNFDRFVDIDMKDALILSGNTMWWQVRYGQGNTSIVCDRGSNWQDGSGTSLTNYQDDPMDNVDSLQSTYHWVERTLKYSILGSIGSDFLHGGNGMDGGNTCYNGFDGFKIILDNSPLINGSHYTGTGFHNGDILKFSTNEYDGTLVKHKHDPATGLETAVVDLDGNGHPQLDISALGFYRAEMIGYDFISATQEPDIDAYGSNLYPNYAPFMVLQKNCNSGTIVNVNSNEWCADWGIGQGGHTFPLVGQHCNPTAVTADTRLGAITANIIELMVDDQVSGSNGDNLFTPGNKPIIFSLKPSHTNVSYIACGGSNGSIRFTPCGVDLNSAYKVDHGFTYDKSQHLGDYEKTADYMPNIFSASIDYACSNYNNGIRKSNAAHESKSGNYQNSFGDLNAGLKNQSGAMIYPNPNNGSFTIRLDNNTGQIGIEVYNTIGGLVLSKQFTSENNNSFKVEGLDQGVYLVRIIGAGGLSKTEKVFVTK